MKGVYTITLLVRAQASQHFTVSRALQAPGRICLLLSDLTSKPKAYIACWEATRPGLLPLVCCCSVARFNDSDLPLPICPRGGPPHLYGYSNSPWFPRRQSGVMERAPSWHQMDPGSNPGSLSYLLQSGSERGLWSQPAGFTSQCQPL